METTSSVAVPVVGMHRSGTSMVARMLEAGGVGFGAETELAGPDADNLHGFWEHQGLRGINEELLRRLGGDWRNPPQDPTQALADPRHDDLRARARTLLQELKSSADIWGWKDPRTSLLLPFWMPLLPSEPRAVMCLRHPADVAASLASRNQLPVQLSGFLWQEYVALVCSQLHGREVLVVSYERILEDPAREAQRLADFLKVGDVALDPVAMAAAVDRKLAHHRSPTPDFLGWREEGLELYAQLQEVASGGLSWSAVVAKRPPREPGFVALMGEAARLAAALDFREHAYADRVREEEQARAAIDEAREEMAQVEDGLRQEREERLRLESVQQELEQCRTRMDNLLGRFEVRLGNAIRRIIRRPSG